MSCRRKWDQIARSAEEHTGVPPTPAITFISTEQLSERLGRRVLPDPDCPWRMNIVLRHPPVRLDWMECGKGWESRVEGLDVLFRVEPIRRGIGFYVTACWPGGKWLGLLDLSDDQEIAKAAAGYLAAGLMPVKREPIDL